MMSDHLCSMNETLSKQREEIDMLKLGSKVQDLSSFYTQASIKNVSLSEIVSPSSGLF